MLITRLLQFQYMRIWSVLTAMHFTMLFAPLAHADDAGGLNGLVELIGSVDDPAFQLDLLGGMAAALKGRANVPAPKGWEALAEKLRNSNNEKVRKKIAELSLQFGDQAAMNKLIAQAADRSAERELRIRAIELLTQKRVAAFKPHVGRLLDEPAMRTAAIKALAVYESPADAAKLVAGFSELASEQKPVAIQTFCSRISYARELLAGLEEGLIPAREVSAFHARQLQSFNNDEINRRLKAAWGELRTSSEMNRRQIERLLKAMSEEMIAKADSKHGRVLFQKTCASCHTLFDDGGNIGPNLTGSNRNNLLYVLENVIDPSASVAKDYMVTSIRTADGRQISGIVGRQTDRTMEVQTLKEKLVLDRSEIDAMKPSTKSMMPDGLFEKMSDADIRDLIGYLRSERQVELVD